MIDEALHVFPVNLARHNYEAAFYVGVAWTRRTNVRHGSGDERSTIARERIASEHMAQLHFFRLEVFRIVRVGFAPNRHLLDHLESITFQTNHFLRVVG